MYSLNDEKAIEIDAVDVYKRQPMSVYHTTQLLGSQSHTHVWTPREFVCRGLCFGFFYCDERSA